MLGIVFQLVPVYNNFRISTQIFDCLFLNASLQVSFWDPSFLLILQKAMDTNVLGFPGFICSATPAQLSCLLFAGTFIQSKIKHTHIYE